MASGNEHGVKRRDFLRALGLSPLVAVPTLGAEARADSESREERVKARYRETEHVKTYYRVNRYPGKGG